MRLISGEIEHCIASAMNGKFGKGPFLSYYSTMQKNIDGFSWIGYCHKLGDYTGGVEQSFFAKIIVFNSNKYNIIRLIACFYFKYKYLSNNDK